MSADPQTLHPSPRRAGAVDDGAPEASHSGASRQSLPHAWRRVGPVDRAALVITLLHLLPVSWLVVGGGLYLDDLRAQAYARSQPFWSFIIGSNGTHLAPGPRTLDWLQARYVPLEHWPAVAVTLAIHLALGLAAWWLLRELVGPRPAALVPLTVVLLSPAILSATAWYRQALTTLVPVALVLAATACAVRLVRSRDWRWGAGAVGLICTGLMFSERAIAGCALVVATALAVRLHERNDGRGGGRHLSRVLALPALLAAALAVVTGLYVWAYRSGPFDQGTTGGLHATDGLDLLARSLGVGIVPALFGGPWRWFPSGPALSAADTPLALALACCLGLAVALVVRVRRHGGGRVALGALLVAAAYILPIEAFVLVGRYAAFGPVIAAALRFFADCAVVLTIALAVAFLGLRSDPGSAEPRPRPARRSWVGRTIAAAVSVAVVVGTTVSWVGFAERWHTNATPAYLAALRSDLAAANRFGPNATQTVLPGAIPDDVIPGWMQAEISTLDLVALLSPSTELAVDHTTLKVVSPEGHLVDGEVRTVQTFDAGDSTFCHHRLAPGASEPLVIAARTVVDHQRDQLVELGLLVNDESRVDVDVTTPDGGVVPMVWPRATTLPRGPYVVRLRVPHDVDVAAVRIHPTAAGLCVVSVRSVVPQVTR